MTENPLAGAPLRVRRVFTTRSGGVSAAPYDSFNLGDHVGDATEAVAANRIRLADSVGLAPERLVWMEQVHSRNVTVVDGPVADPVEVTDALVTNQVGLALVVLTADCVPLLLADDETGIIAAVHAGRIGARIGIVRETLEAMVKLGAEPARIGALLGPSACGKCYEVPAHMRADVSKHLPGSASQTRSRTPALDIAAGVRRQLEDFGVGAIAVDPRCTIEDKELFSHRRGAPTGRIAGAIWTELAQSESAAGHR